MVLQSLLPVAFATAPYTAAQLANTPYTAIKLTFQAEAPYKPDGDSIRMKAANPALWPPHVKLSERDQTAQSRMEGIDAVELHFYGHHQPLRLAEAARDFLFAQLRIPKKNPPSEGVPGWALTRSADLYGRDVSFLFPQEVPLVDGAQYMVGDASFSELLQQSANYKMLQGGQAYPMFYEYLPDVMLQSMQEASKEAQKRGRGVWSEDRTLTGGVRLTEVENADAAVIYPKLYRRLVRYFRDFAPIMWLGRFREFMELDPDLLHLASDVTAGEVRPKLRQLHDPDILEIDTKYNHLRLLVSPEQLIFHERTKPNPRLPAH